MTYLSAIEAVNQMNTDASNARSMTILTRQIKTNYSSIKVVINESLQGRRTQSEVARPRDQRGVLMPLKHSRAHTRMREARTHNTLQVKWESDREKIHTGKGADCNTHRQTRRDTSADCNTHKQAHRDTSTDCNIHKQTHRDTNVDCNTHKQTHIRTTNKH